MPRDFRFGLGLRDTSSAAKVRDAARLAEDLGYDVLLVPDHLGAPAPMPVLATVAAASQTLRLGTFVLNACFYKPALLARDVAALHDLSGGRFEVGLGAGYVREEFEAAELPFPSARRRIEYLEHVVEYLTEHVPGAPIMIAGGGDRLLTVAARWASIVGVTGTALAERIAFLREAAGARFGEIELNVAITAVPTDGSGVPNLAMTRHYAPGLTDEQLLALPGVLSGSVTDMAAKVRGVRDTLGANYLVVQANHAEAFGKVIAALR
ncbi:TIGR03621 family F420-dependent LLM class oxidoreductase [Mycolicibacterium diernhoferi]|uniref:F420-dependent oxidoreductase n=1 Tax=Mycolicibacterium diernhoferi TaxID=1801 RepID=A0A1Q4H4L5_9MYCO|nr:TIGR03621 family F420-dependent LLM class oxidoreductase [Mycolicibacterium diernhoferi]OJZ62488.1 F420-dependent oxidoreductase [Mycolicibacterium diernhoferi]OPE49329.1 F420-dependent oxidoreductase [Mycolicibacterium diernhoferi]PEG52201.1 LLM class F420-dependent oxidoreductase [Mycolicibacterium diernhoferi]QYL21999.1 TIGR03621 family F420-dependent LLM class oxidoreductase [Mycolicibacterium diernhoferi]